MRNVIRDLAGLVGCGLVAVGAWMIFPPAGLISGGVLLLAIALLSGRSS